MILLAAATTTTAMFLIISITMMMVVVATVDAFHIEKRPNAFVAPKASKASVSSIYHHRCNDLSFLQFDRRRRYSFLSIKSAKQNTRAASRTVAVSATTTTKSINDVVYDDNDDSQEDTTNPTSVAEATATTAATNLTMNTFPSSSLSLSESQTIASDDSNNNNVDATTFQDCGIVHPSVLYAIEQQYRNWIIPTPIQRLAIPRLLSSIQPEHQQQQQPFSKSDESSSEATAVVAASSLRTTTTNAVWCEAPTGSGKTASYVLPLLQNLLHTSSKKHLKQRLQNHKQTIVRSLILCPTRELVLQIGAVVNDLVSQMNVHQKNTNSTSNANTKKDAFRRPIFNVVLLYGGSGSSSSSSSNTLQPQSPPEINLLSTTAPSNGPTPSAAAVIDILIATPGRLLDMITEENTSSLSSSKKNRMYNNNKSEYNDDDEYDDNDKLLEQQILQALDTTTPTPDKKYRKKRPNRPNNDGRRERGKSSSSSSDRSLSLHQLQSLQLVDPTAAAETILSSHNSNRNTIVLNQLQYFILDEADRLLSNAFEKDMNQIVQHMIVGSSLLPTNTNINYTNRQSLPHIIPNTWLFSATFPKQIEPNIDRFLQRLSPNPDCPPSSTERTLSSCVRISCTNSDRTLQEDTSNTLYRKMERPNSIVSNVPTIQQIGPQSTIVLRTIRLEKRHRTQVLRLLIEENMNKWDRILVFVGTRYSSEMISRKLRRYDIRSAELHGKLHQEARIRRLQDLTSGKIRVLIATDVASRGLDIDGLPVVINYDLPRSPADFVHRIGRTGRAGRDGTAVTFVTPDTDSHFQLIEQRYILNRNTDIDGQRHTSYPRETIPGFEPDEELWRIETESTKYTVPGTVSSAKGLAHDRMYGGIKGRRKSKKDKLRELEQQQ